MKTHPDYVHYEELFGLTQAQRLFVQHVRRLREDFTEGRLRAHLGALRTVLSEVLSDLSVIADRCVGDAGRSHTHTSHTHTYTSSKHSSKHTHTNTQTGSKETRTHTHAHSPKHTHPNTHTYIHTHTHTHAHTH